MANLRFEVVAEAFKKKPCEVPTPQERPSEYFGKNVFNRQKMYKYLSKDVYNKLIDVIDNGTRLDRSIADAVAMGMRKWADENGVTHYTHWFQPLTEGTAEKHDAFIEHDGKGGMIEEFSGKLLVQQEPDASSFPSGGIRNTFEARGYSAWDPTSPVFIIDDTLCIPTIFISYTGEALDYKAPLLRSLHAVNVAATNVCHYFYPNVKKVTSNLGWEQEYFLVDESLYSARPDLMLTGRTLMGHDSAKNQQMDDHYFGTIPERVQAFMKDLEIQALELGIPVKTRHNEVAPNQFELAPIYEETNLAVDHNMLLMSLMKKVARKHGFRALLHEKPFAGINGSGKHNNWSLSTDTGILLHGPGKTPEDNLRFVTFIVETLMGVYRHNGLMKASIMSATNAHRLGANEAPPAIISSFLGKQLSDLLEHIEKADKEDLFKMAGKQGMVMDIPEIPELLIDNTDRNRTSPFAFTGNRFEFRAVGSEANCAAAMIVLNTAVAEALTNFKVRVDERIANGENKEAAIIEVIREDIKTCKPIHFDGNGYSEEWVEEATRRGLDVETSCPVIFERYLDEGIKRQFFNFAGNNSKTTAVLTGSSRFNGSIQCQKISLTRNRGYNIGTFLNRSHLFLQRIKTTDKTLIVIFKLTDILGNITYVFSKLVNTLKVIDKSCLHLVNIFEFGTFNQTFSELLTLLPHVVHFTDISHNTVNLSTKIGKLVIISAAHGVDIRGNTFSLICNFLDSFLCII